MEKNILKKSFSENSSSDRNSKPSGSKYFYFLLGFILLIVASNNYNKNLNTDKSASASIVNYPAEKSSRAPEDSKQEKIVDFAIDHLGIKYTAAGKKPTTGFDCSGFTSFVYRQLGIDIGPSSIVQSKTGEKVTLKEAEKGDLIFFKSPTPDNNNIGHVGIIISNTNNNISFIHSSSSRGVVIDNLNSKHYKSRFRVIRRVL